MEQHSDSAISKLNSSSDERTKRCIKKFVVLAKGSRGDVQPAVALVCALRLALNKDKTIHGAVIVLVTEALARPLFGHLLAKHGIELLTYHDNQMRTNNRKRFLASVAPIVSRTNEPHVGASAAKAVQVLREIHEYQVALDACGSDTTCLLFSLFSLEGYSIAEKIGCAALLYSPHVIPYKPPVEVAHDLGSAYPDLFVILHERSVGDGTQLWQHVVEWMWPLLSDYWTKWRVNRLSLDPLLEVMHHSFQLRTGLGSSTCAHTRAATPNPISEIESNATVDTTNDTREIYDTSVVHNHLRVRNLFVPVLYAVSKHLVDRPSKWPASMQLAGPWLLNDISPCIPNNLGHCGTTLKWIRDARQQVATVAYVTLGSMPKEAGESILCPANQRRFVRLLCQVVCSWNGNSEEPISRVGVAYNGNVNGLVVVFNACGNSELCLAWDEVIAHEIKNNNMLIENRLYIHRTSDLDDMAVLPLVHVIVHHGGAGTMTTACLRGVSQVVLPVMHDQHANARTVVRKGIGCSPATLSDLLTALPTTQATSVLYKALRQCTSDLSIHQHVLDLREAMANEQQQETPDQQQEQEQKQTHPFENGQSGCVHRAAQAVLQLEATGTRINLNSK